MSEKKSSEPLLPCLERNLEAIRDALRTSSDLAVHEFNFGHDRRYRGAIVFISDMADKDEINKNILQPLMFGSLLMIMEHMNDTKGPARYSFFGVLVGAASLLIVSVRNTAVLGRTQTIWTSPSFQSIRLIDIGTVLTRMDFLIGIAQTMLIFFKCSIFLYALTTALSQLFGLKSYKPLVLPVVGIEVIIAATVFQSPVDHAEITQNAGIIYSAPLIYLFPPLTLLIAKIRGLPKIERSKGK